MPDVEAVVAPAPDVACDLPDEGTAKVDNDRQAHHFTTASFLPAKKKHKKATDAVLSERKRSREKQRREDINKQFTNLTDVIKKLEAEELKIQQELLKEQEELELLEGSNKRPRTGVPRPYTSPVCVLPPFSPTNRVDLIARTILHLERLSHSVVTTTTDDGTDAAPSCSDEVSLLSTEEEAMMQQIRGIAQGGYFEGLEALKFGRPIPTTNLVEPQRIRSVTPLPLTTHTLTRTTTITPTRQSHSPQRAVEITPDVIDLPTLAILKNEMSKLRYSKKKPKEGRWAHWHILLQPKILTAGSKILVGVLSCLYTN